MTHLRLPTLPSQMIRSKFDFLNLTPCVFLVTIIISFNLFNPLRFFNLQALRWFQKKFLRFFINFFEISSFLK
jgi:hypothetical protein